MIDGSSIQIHCAGNPNSLRSAALNFVVLDEFGFMDPEIWPAVVRPTRQHIRDSRTCRKHKQCIYSTYIHPRWRVAYQYRTDIPIRKQSGRPAAEAISTEEQRSGDLSPRG